MSPIEAFAFILGVINVALVVRRSIWNYPFGIAMVALYAWIFTGAKLYSDALLQVFFFIVQIYGWWAWARAKAATGDVAVERLDLRGQLAWLSGIVIATACWGWLMHRYTDAVFPWWDAGIAMASVAAQILMSRRFIENWWLWIAVDVAAIGLYAARDLWLTSVLYAIFLGLSIWGVMDWKRAAK